MLTAPQAKLDYRSTVLADSPLVYWRLGETSGTTATDASGNARHGTYSGSPTLGVTGALIGDTNTAVTFDGVDDQVSVADTTDLTAYTAEAWVKTTNSAAGELDVAARLGSAGTSRIFLLYVGAGKASGIFYNSTGTQLNLSSPGSIADGNWHHIAMAYTAGTSTGRLYLDGSQVATGTRAGPLSTADVPFTVGTSAFVSRFIGSIDEVAYYGTELSAARILAHYNAGIGL